MTVPVPGGAPLDQTVLDLLRQSAIGPALDKPVNQILADMGLPQLPAVAPAPPMPGLPPLPVIDLASLFKPLTDLASTFGTGQLGSGGGPDPTQLLEQISSSLQTAISLGSTGLQALDSLWQGMGSQAAVAKGTQAQADGANLSTQAAETKTGVVAASATVAKGAAEMTAVITKFAATVAAATPFLVTGAGQAVILAAATEALTEATVVVAETRGELGVHSANMTATGQPVPVTDAPSGINPLQIASQLLSTIAPLATQGVKAATDAAKQHVAAQKLAAETKEAELSATGGGAGGAALKPGGGGGGGVGLAGGGGGGIGGIGGVPVAPLSPWTGTSSAGTSAPAASSANPSGGGGRSVTGEVVQGGPGIMPMGAAGAAAAGMGMGRDAGDAGSAVSANLVTAQHGDEVVGEIAGISPPVVGEADLRVSESPDKELTL